MKLHESCRTMRNTSHLLVLLTILYFVHGSPFVLSTFPHGKPTTFNLTGRIVNGTQAVLGQFPHQVSLMRSYSGTHFCGGSLISASLVLTAGHCMYSDENVIQPWTIKVLGGVVNLNDNSSRRQEKGVQEIMVHPKFDLANLYNDVAVLKLSAPFTFTPEIHKVPLSGSPIVPETVCQISGWGYPSSDVHITYPDLMYVDLPILRIEECRKLLENETDLPAGMFCAGYLEGGKDACNGDSGGGMICNDVLTGIVSGGIGCAEPLLPGVYTDVYHYLDWIISGTEVVVVVEGHNGNYGTCVSNTLSIMTVIMSFFFCAIINYT